MNIFKFFGIGVASTSYVAARLGVFGTNTLYLTDETLKYENYTLKVTHHYITNTNYHVLNEVSYICNINDITIEFDKPAIVSNRPWFIRPVNVIHTSENGINNRY